MQLSRPIRRPALGAFIGASLVSIGLYVYASWRSGSYGHNYLIINLVLAWVPLILGLHIVRVLKTKRWSSWEGLITTLVWLAFLPNSFYMFSDYVHLPEVPSYYLLLYVVTFTSFIFTASALGFVSLSLFHQKLKQRLGLKAALVGVNGVLLLTSIAIFIGRDLRWNSWDLILNPGGVLFDVSDRLVHPTAYPNMLLTIVSFFILLASLYWLVFLPGRHLADQPV